MSYLSREIYVLTLCCELQRHETNLIIKLTIKFTYILYKKYFAEFSRLVSLFNGISTFEAYLMPKRFS